MNNHSHTGFGSADWLMNAVRKNPEGLLLLAAGCALLLRSGRSSASQSHRAPHYSGSRGHHSGYSDSGGGDRGMSESMTQAADKAREYVSDVGKTISETANEYVSAAGDYVDAAQRTIVEQSERMVEQAQGTIERIAREQPLAVAIAGLAAGAAIAAAFPTTRIERETLGQTGKTVSEAASSAGERLSEAASAAGERLMEVAEEKGLSKEGLKDIASDVAESFEKSVTGGSRQGGGSQSTTSVSGSDTGRLSPGAMSPGVSGSQNVPTERKASRPESKTSTNKFTG